jgi:hypothetical protein
MEIQLYGRSRFEFEKLFPEAKFEGYEYNIHFCYFSFKKKVSKSKILRLCESKKIKVLEII